MLLMVGREPRVREKRTVHKLRPRVSSRVRPRVQLRRRSSQRRAQICVRGRARLPLGFAEVEGGVRIRGRCLRGGTRGGGGWRMSGH